MPDSRGPGEGLERIEEFSYPAVGGINVIPGGVSPRCCQDRGRHRGQGCNHSRARLPAGVGFALEPGVSLRWIDAFSTAE
jgi:hypothetical protein